MSSTVASLVQYPLPCPECKAYTSKAAEDLLRDRKVSCRLCAKETRLSDQQLASIKRTLEHMTDCGIGKDEEAPLETEQEALVD